MSWIPPFYGNLHFFRSEASSKSMIRESGGNSNIRNTEGSGALRSRLKTPWWVLLSNSRILFVHDPHDNCIATLLHALPSSLVTPVILKKKESDDWLSFARRPHGFADLVRHDPLGCTFEQGSGCPLRLEIRNRRVRPSYTSQPPKQGRKAKHLCTPPFPNLVVLLGGSVP